jgi:C-terminal processing protease CtpA/Prc
MGATESYFPPITWEWIEDNLVITKVDNAHVDLRPGDIVTSIDGSPAKNLFNEIYPEISAATPGWLHYRASTISLMGTKNSSLTLKVLDSNGNEKQLSLVRNLSGRDHHSLFEDTADPIRQVTDAVYYVNLSTASMSQITGRLGDFKNAKSIIFDLRGYPKSNHQIISHLLHDNDTSRRWMRVPQIIYPDQQNISGWAEMGWSMKPEQPHLDAKIFFLLDGRAVSYAESFMSFIEHYKLGTIIGQPSAGTNGNVNRFQVPGGYTIAWTGMKVLKHDGTPLHGVGILPDVYVEKTIKGVREQRDEFLEKAIQLATQLDNQSR